MKRMKGLGMAQFCLLASLVLLGVQVSHGSEVLVRTTAELFTAIGNPAVTTIFLNETLDISAKDWPRTVNITRSVMIAATPERFASRTYVLLNFKTVAMMFQLLPGITILFRGLELVNHYDTVGPTFRPLRQSIGATAVFADCVQRRRAGLPYKAAIVNMLEATRPVGLSGPQVCRPVTNLTYRTTRSSEPVVYPEAVMMADYATVVTPDSSLAYQNLYYGGYTYVTNDSYYAVDNTVTDECLDQRPGTDCVSLLLQQLDGVGHDAAGQQQRQTDDGDDGGDNGNEKKKKAIIIGVVVPVTVVLLAAVVAAMLLRRRRRHLDACRREREQPAGPSVRSGSGGKGRAPTLMAAAAGVQDRGCVFMGLEEDQQLPEWSPLAADVAEDEEKEDGAHDLKHGLDATQTAGISILTDTDTPLLGNAGGGGDGGGRETGCGGGQQLQPRLAASPSNDTSTAAPDSGLLRPAVSTQVDGCCDGQKDGIAAASAAAGAGAGSSDPASSGRSGAPAGMDVQAELGRLALELRASVRDEAIRLETIIGSGSFGTVYKGTWQGLAVAVKTLVFSASDENRRRALQEAALCASINHPNVVATYSSELQPLGTLGAGGPQSATSAEGGPESGNAVRRRELSQILEWRLYIVQEYADGGPLRKLYGNRALWPAPGEVNLPAVIGLALGIARALAHLHSKRIIHGDLNPNNVLLKRDANEPSGYAIKVGDFGLSVMLPQNRTHLSNLRMGTMFYMCPAVVMKGQVGPPSDVFSLGVMLWELYHGRRAGIRTEQGPRYSSIFPAFPPTCPEAYRAVALHCLQRQPQNRPSAALVELHLERLLAAVTVMAAAAAPVSPWSGPNPVAGPQRASAPAPMASVLLAPNDEGSSAPSGSGTLPLTQYAQNSV